MKHIAVFVIAATLAGCATPGQPTLLDAIVYSPTVDPASIRDPAKYQLDRFECKQLVQRGSLISSFEQDAARFVNCLRGRGYSVL